MFSIVFLVYRPAARSTGQEALFLMLATAGYGFMTCAVAALVSQRRRLANIRNEAAELSDEDFMSGPLIAAWRALWPVFLGLSVGSVTLTLVEAGTGLALFPYKRGHAGWLEYCPKVEIGDRRPAATYRCSCGPECASEQGKAAFLTRFERAVCRDTDIGVFVRSGDAVAFIISTPGLPKPARFDADMRSCSAVRDAIRR